MFPQMKFPDTYDPKPLIEKAYEGNFTELIEDYNQLSITAFPSLVTYTVENRGADTEEIKAHNALNVYNIDYLQDFYHELMIQHKADLAYESWASILSIANWEYVCLALREIPYDFLEKFLFEDNDLIKRWLRTVPIKDLAKNVKHRPEPFFAENKPKELKLLLADMLK